MTPNERINIKTRAHWYIRVGRPRIVWLKRGVREALA